MKQFGVEESDIQRLQLELLKEQDVATLLLKQKKRDEVTYRLGKISLPEEGSCKRLCWWRSKDFVNAVEYLYERGFDVITDNRLWYSDTKTSKNV